MSIASHAVDELWSLLDTPTIDPGCLIAAIEAAASEDDLDLADEVPAEIRDERSMLAELTSRFGLRLAHFQTRYLPSGWSSRTTDGGSYAKILLRLVDPYDIIAGKVFSSRTRDRDDVRVVSRRLDRVRLLERVHEYPAAVWDDGRLRDQAMKTWRLVFLEDLPLPPHAGVDPWESGSCPGS